MSPNLETGKVQGKTIQVHLFCPLFCELMLRKRGFSSSTTTSTTTSEVKVANMAVFMFHLEKKKRAFS